MATQPVRRESSAPHNKRCDEAQKSSVTSLGHPCSTQQMSADRDSDSITHYASFPMSEQHYWTSHGGWGCVGRTEFHTTGQFTCIFAFRYIDGKVVPSGVLEGR